MGGAARDGVDENAASAERAALLDVWSRRYRRALIQFFERRTPRGADREDLVQEVFLRLARRGDLDTIERVDGYIFQAAASVLADWRRRALSHAADAHDALAEDVQDDVGLSPERVLIGKDTLQALIASLALLPERTRAVFVLYHFEFLHHAEIGRRLGMAVRTVEDHMARANTHIASLMLDRT